MICKSWLRADKDAGAGAFLTKYLEALFNIGDMIKDTSAEYQQVQAVKSESCQCWNIVRTWIVIENNLHWPQAWDNVVISVPLWKPECLRGWGWWGKVRDEIEQTHSFTKWDAAPNLTHWVSYQISSDEYFLCTAHFLLPSIFCFLSRRCNNNTSEAWLLPPSHSLSNTGCWSVFTPLFIIALPCIRRLFLAREWRKIDNPRQAKTNFHPGCTFAYSSKTLTFLSKIGYFLCLYIF